MAENGVLKRLTAVEQRAQQTRLLSYLIGAAVVAALALVFILPRSVSLGSFVTADEPTWGKRGASFFYAMKDGDYPATYQTGHPGVITMWAGAIAYQLRFPEYEQVGQLDLGDTKLLQIFMNQGTNPMEVMATARLVVVLFVTAAAMASFFFAWRLFGAGLAVFGFLLVAFDPLYVAHSRVLHTNGLLASFMFLSLLAYLYYLRRGSAAGLVVSAVGAGLSFVCISPGIVLVPAVGLLTLGGLWDAERRRFDLSLKSITRRAALPLLAWGAIALLAVYLVWPAMWGDPVGTLVRMLQYGMSAAEGDIGGAHFVGAYRDLDGGSSYPFFYPLTYLWRGTPVVLAGIGLAVLALAFRRATLRPEVRRSLFDLAGFVLVYGLVMTLGSKKFDRYFLPAYLPLDLIAAAGWMAAAGWLAAQFTLFKRSLLQYGLIAAVLAVQVFSALLESPYYFTYFNPLMGGLRRAPESVTVGWGEGLNEAALFLSQQPGACDGRILSWYTLAYSWYSISFGCEAEMVEITPDITLEEYLGYDYIVIYINQIQRNQPADLLAYLNTLEPLHSVRIKGVEFVRIYQLHTD